MTTRAVAAPLIPGETAWSPCCTSTHRTIEDYRGWSLTATTTSGEALTVTLEPPCSYELCCWASHANWRSRALVQ